MKKEHQFIFKILIAITVILISISVFLPWATVESSGLSESGYMEFYSWGMFLSSSFPSPENPQFMPYFSFMMMIFSEGVDLDTYNNLDYSVFLMTLFLSCLILPFLILSLISSIYLIFTIERGKYELIIGSSIIYFITLILFYILIQYGFIGTFGKPSQVIINYSTGFYFVILSILLMVSSYVSIRYLTMSKKEMNSMNNPLETLKNRYANGEIDKEEFERMKKDIEEE